MVLATQKNEFRIQEILKMGVLSSILQWTDTMLLLFQIQLGVDRLGPACLPDTIWPAGPHRLRVDAG